MRCRVCGGKLYHLETAEEVMENGICLRAAPFKSGVRRMALYKCPCCTHVQAENTLLDDYYESYSEWGGAGQYAASLDFTRKKLEKLRSYASTGQIFLDIGCGTGKAMTAAKGLFERAIGVEPAHNTYSIAKERGLDVINAYFSEKLELKEQISAFSAFQVFEHLSDVYEVLDYALEILEPGGVGLINIPNGQEIVERSVYYELLFEHINYFSPYSLSVMAHRAGFEIIEVENVPQTMELDIYVKKPLRSSGFNEKLHTQRKRLSEAVSEYRAVVVWGAGAKSEKYARLLEKPSAVKRLVDSDKRKAGLYVAGIDCPVELASARAVEDAPAVVIFASAYNDEIIRQLREEFSYRGDIIYFDNNDEVRLLRDM